MFDKRTFQSLDQPRRVLVELGRSLTLARHSKPANKLPLWVLSHGYRLEAVMPGELLAWCRLSDGQFLAQVQVTVSNSVRPADSLDLVLWVTQDAIGPA